MLKKVAGERWALGVCARARALSGERVEQIKRVKKSTHIWLALPATADERQKIKTPLEPRDAEKKTKKVITRATFNYNDTRHIPHGESGGAPRRIG